LFPERQIVHMDMDTFFVSVERLKNPKLVGMPVLVGGFSDRAVVASCSYETRKFGVHSAMPMKLARQLCPEAIVVKGDMDSYSDYSKMVTQVIADKAPVFEKTSIDEHYIDASGMDKYIGTYKWTHELREKIMKETHLPISFGLSPNKTVSKIATGQAKPNGELQILAPEVHHFLDPLSIKKIPGIGKKTEDALYQMGVRDIHTLRQIPIELLEMNFGKNGIAIWKKANGIDNNPVEPYSVQKSMGHEMTLNQDTTDVKELKRLLLHMVELLAFDLRKKKKLCACITVKIRYSTFDTFSKQMTIPYTSADHHLIDKAFLLFNKLYEKRLLIRMIGVKVSHLVEGNYQIHLFEDSKEQILLYNALDKVRLRFGETSVMRAAGLMTYTKENLFTSING